MLLEKLLKTPGFIYQIKGNYYFLGKWICKECTNVDETDCVTMCRKGQEEPDTNMYFQKIRAYSDFALEIPYDPNKIRSDMALILDTLSEEEIKSLTQQVENVESDVQKYCS